MQDMAWTSQSADSTCQAWTTAYPLKTGNILLVISWDEDDLMYTASAVTYSRSVLLCCLITSTNCGCTFWFELCYTQRLFHTSRDGSYSFRSPPSTVGVSAEFLLQSNQDWVSLRFLGMSRVPSRCQLNMMYESTSHRQRPRKKEILTRRVRGNGTRLWALPWRRRTLSSRNPLRSLSPRQDSSWPAIHHQSHYQPSTSGRHEPKAD